MRGVSRSSRLGVCHLLAAVVRKRAPRVAERDARIALERSRREWGEGEEARTAMGMAAADLKICILRTIAKVGDPPDKKRAISGLWSLYSEAGGAGHIAAEPGSDSDSEEDT